MSGTTHAQWREEPGSGAAIPLARLRLVLTDDGHWALDTTGAADGHIVVDGDTQVIDDTVSTGQRIALRDDRTVIY